VNASASSGEMNLGPIDPRRRGLLSVTAMTFAAAKLDLIGAHRLIAGGVGHKLPQEAPQAFAQAVVDVDAY